MLYIFGQDEKLLAILSNDNPKSCPYFSAPHTEKLNGENTFDFSVPFSHEDSVYVLEENLVAFKDLDNNYQLFIIRQVEETHEFLLYQRPFECFQNRCCLGWRGYISSDDQR